MKIKIVCEKSKYDKLKEEFESKGISVVDDSNFVLFDLSSENNQIRVQSKNETVMLDISDIVAVESFNHDIYIYSINEEIVTRTPLKEIRKMLNDSFIQISQSVIINRNFIKKIRNGFNYRFIVFMNNGKEFVVTKTYYYKFIEELGL